MDHTNCKYGYRISYLGEVICWDGNVVYITGEGVITMNAIKPDHYRKGKIDLYESWYQTYPFNEFRAIMQAIAERYMKRDKEDRIQDLDKAIYTLQRLKEYEEKQATGINGDI